MATSRIRGMEQLFANLRAFPAQLQQQVLGPAVSRATSPMRDRAAALAPRLTGRLAGAVSMARDQRPELANMSVRYVVFVRYKGADAAAYWRYVEFGTSFQAPQPFLRTAFETMQGNAIVVFLQEVATRVPRVLAGMSK